MSRTMRDVSKEKREAVIRSAMARQAETDPRVTIPELVRRHGRGTRYACKSLIAWGVLLPAGERKQRGRLTKAYRLMRSHYLVVELEFNELMDHDAQLDAAQWIEQQ